MPSATAEAAESSKATALVILTSEASELATEFSAEKPEALLFPLACAVVVEPLNASAVATESPSAVELAELVSSAVADAAEPS